MVESRVWLKREFLKWSSESAKSRKEEKFGFKLVCLLQVGDVRCSGGGGWGLNAGVAAV